MCYQTGQVYLLLTALKTILDFTDKFRNTLLRYGLIP